MKQMYENYLIIFIQVNRFVLKFYRKITNVLLDLNLFYGSFNVLSCVAELELGSGIMQFS
jgi:hypothetical protein